MRHAVILIAVLFQTITSFSQGVQADFSIPSQACLGQRVVLANNSSNASRYEWDLCQGDLSLTPTGGIVRLLNGSVPTGVDVVFDGTNWFGFVTNQGSNSIQRLDFGDDITSTPTVTDLGNISGNISAPTDIKIVNDNGNWYGFVYCLSGSLISRINFGVSLSNTTSSQTPITADVVLSGAGSVNGGFDIINDGSQWVIVLTFNSSITVARMPSVTGVPTASDMIPAITDTYASALGDIVLQKSNGIYYGYVVAWGNKSLQKLTFGSNLFSTPAFANINVPLILGFTPYGVDIGRDAGDYFLFISTLEGTTLKLNLTSDLSTATVSATSLGNFTTVENTLKIRLVKDKSNWYAFSPSWQSTRFFRITFTNPSCDSGLTSVLTTQSPSVFFPTSGQKFITLRAFDNYSWFADSTNSVTVTSDTSPTIDFSVNGICTAGSTSFSSQSPDNIQSYNWDFGDASSAATASPTHVYSSSGTYSVGLAVTAPNGCINSASRDIKIYNKPSASFNLPQGLICTNNQFIFNNTTADNFDGNLTYEWSVGGSLVSTSRDLQYTLTSPGDNSVKLKTSIPGCFDEVTNMVSNVLAGPSAGFTFTGKCENDSFSFSNSSAGDISGYSWTFGDGNTSTATNPSNVYPSKGSYLVTLNTTATNGCVSTTSTSVDVYSLPAPSFSLDLPPFSCSGTPSQFHDTTPSMTDSNIQTWNWTFGDTGTGTGKNPVHTYTNAGPYTARLSVTTDRGCSNYVNKQVTIAQSPNAMFNVDAACVNKATHFVDASTGNITSWQWKVGSALYNSATPTHTFAASGNYNVQLVVTGQNNCTSSLTRQVIVPVVPALDFQVTNPCSNQTAVFNDLTTNPADPISEHNWSFGTATATGQQASYIFPNGVNYNVQLAVKAQSGCSYSMTRQVAIHPSPVANFTMSDHSGPPPLRVVFTNTTTGASGYVWSFGDGSANVTAASPDHTFASLGDYNVSLAATSVDGCRATASKIISVITPVVDLALEDFLLKQGAGGSYQGYVQIRNNGNYRITSFVVNYETGGGIVLSETVPSDISVGEVKTYTLGTTFNQPSASAFLCVELNPDTDDDNNKACATLASEPTIFTLGPNPADSFLNIESVHPRKEDIRVRLFNMQGGVAYDRTFAVDQGLSRMSLDLQNLSPGAYVVVVTSGATTSSNRLLILR